MLPNVGFLAIAPGRLPVAAVPILDTAVVPEKVRDRRPGSGMTDDLRDPVLAVSEPEGEVGFISATLGGARAASRTSLRK